MDAIEESIEIELNLTAEDFFRALVRLNLRRFWFLLIIPSFGLADFFFKASDSRRGLQPADFVSVVAVILFYGFILVGAPYLSARAIMKSQNFMAPIRYRFSEGGIDIVASGSTAHHDWSMVEKVQESDLYIMLFVPKNCLHLFPKSMIGDRIDALKQLLRSHAGKNVRFRA